MTQGKFRPWEEWEDLKLRREWARSTSIEVIAEELERKPSDVKRRRMALGLPPRRFLKARRKVSLQVDSSMFSALGRRAHETGKTVSDYLRSLIRRDLGT